MEYHLFILWEKAQNKKNDIIEDISKNLDVFKIVDITWDKNLFIDNLIRFYGQSRKIVQIKADECGYGTFTLILVKDNNPNYQLRNTSSGDQLVNINIFDRKELYRSWTNDETTPKNYHGSRVHGSNDILEAKHDLAILVGYSFEEIDDNSNIIPNSITQNTLGLNGWDSFNQLFKTLNLTSKYALLDNYGDLPDNYPFDKPYCISIITNNKMELISLLNATKKSILSSKYGVLINNQKVYFNIDNVFYLNDSNRTLSKNCFYTLNK